MTLTAQDLLVFALRLDGHADFSHGQRAIGLVSVRHFCRCFDV